MNKNLKLTLIITLLAILTPISGAWAERIGGSSIGTQTGGASGQGIEGKSKSASAICTTDECEDTKSEIRDIEKIIKKEEQKLGQKGLEQELIQQNIDAKKKEIESLQAKYNTLAEEDRKRKEEQKKNEAENKPENNNENINKGNETPSTPDCTDDATKNNDQMDVPPVNKSYLEHGDLLAWGIPFVPTIPIGGPKKSSQGTGEKNIQEVQSSDAGYQSLRTVEQASEKITDTDKDTFLAGLKAQVNKE